MSRTRSLCIRAFQLFAVLLLVGQHLSAQGVGSSVRGTVTDPSGAAIPAATITATSTTGTVKLASSSEQGAYSLDALPPGTYTVRATAPGFSLFERPDLELTSGRPIVLDIPMTVVSERQEVNVTVQQQVEVDTDPANNAGALVLKGADLDTLSDNPDDLASDLQALAGPGAGPNGGEIFIDGFSGGRLPPKESIREVRVNQNPYSAEYDRIGFGRVEIFTKPGTDKLRGQAFFNFGDEALNSRNPFADNRAPYQTRQFGGNISGSINKKTSFFLDMERRAIDDNAVVNATLLDPNTFAEYRFQQAYVVPSASTRINPRLDYAINANNTLALRYSYQKFDTEREGIGQFSLLSRAYDRNDREHGVQVTETAVLGSRAINETRFQYRRETLARLGDNSIPTLSVQDQFTAGGAQIGNAYNEVSRYELQNNTSITFNTHSLRVGGRLRTYSITDTSPQNYGGTFTFAGIRESNISALEQYRQTEILLRQGLTPQQVTAAGFGASQFTLNAGNPTASLSQFDLGLFVQDDWRVRQNITVSLGLRYENQNQISSNYNVAPRIGIAYAFGGNQKAGRRPTVIRGGFGIFYDRFGIDPGLQAVRQNGIIQQQYFVTRPDFYPRVPTPQELQGNLQQQTIRRVDENLTAPYIAQTSLGIERSFPGNTNVSLTYIFSRGVHMLRTRNINAPLPGSVTADNLQGIRPYGANAGNIYNYESTGFMRQHQLIANINTRLGRRISVFGFYSLNKASGDTDGLGSSPANPYDLSTEYGRSSFDIRHRIFLGSSLSAPFGLRLSPFLTARSGVPFNITAGPDINGDTVFTDRPSLVTSGTCDVSNRNIKNTQYGCFNTLPGLGDAVIPRNLGNGPSQVALNLRVSRTWGFGERTGRGNANQPSSLSGSGGPRGGGGGPRGGGGGGGPRGGGMGGFFNDGDTSARYNLTFTVSARNITNTVNLGQPIGSLSSTLFGQSTSVAQGFGDRGQGISGGNRRIEAQLRFSF